MFYVDDDLCFRDLEWILRSRLLNALLTYRLNPFSAVYLGANLALYRGGNQPDRSKIEAPQVFLLEEPKRVS